MRFFTKPCWCSPRTPAWRIDTLHDVLLWCQNRQTPNRRKNLPKWWKKIPPGERTLVFIWSAWPQNIDAWERSFGSVLQTTSQKASPKKARSQTLRWFWWPVLTPKEKQNFSSCGRCWWPVLTPHVCTDLTSKVAHCKLQKKNCAVQKKTRN